MQIIRQDTDYAMRALVYLACVENQQPCSAREIADAQEIPWRYAQKIFRCLVESNITRSVPGRKGGFVLARAPEEIKLVDVICAVQGPVAVNKCFIADGKCPRQPTCPVNVCLGRAQRTIVDILASVTLADILKETSAITS